MLKQIKNTKNQAGLTLIEILIAVSIFSLLSVVVGGIYVAFSSSQARTKVAQSLLNDAQFALEGMAREIRNNSVRYSGTFPCGSIVIGQDDLGGDVYGQNCFYLEKEDGTVSGFAGNVDQNFLSYIVRDPVTGEWSTTGFVFFAPLQDIVIDQLQFVLSPSLAGGDPFAEGGPNDHPLVTIKLIVSTESTKDIEQVTYDLQTSVSPRSYKR